MFSIIVVVSFKDFIPKFIEVYIDDWIGFGLIQDHIENLMMMLECCHQDQILLNLRKCIFCALFEILLGHVVCRDGILVDHANIAIILELPPLTTINHLYTTLGHIGY